MLSVSNYLARNMVGFHLTLVHQSIRLFAHRINDTEPSSASSYFSFRHSPSSVLCLYVCLFVCLSVCVSSVACLQIEVRSRLYICDWNNLLLITVLVALLYIVIGCGSFRMPSGSPLKCGGYQSHVAIESLGLEKD